MNDIQYAKYWHWLLSICGASVAAFAVGIILGTRLAPVAPWLLVIGIVMHAYGMYQVHKMNA